MSKPVLLDTNILIDYLRGHAEAMAFVEGFADRPLTSSVVVAEVYAGVRDGSERVRLERLLEGLTVISLTSAMAVEGGLYRRQYGKSHGVGLTDALIAGTAAKIGAQLATLNIRHFPMLEKVLVPYTANT